MSKSVIRFTKSTTTEMNSVACTNVGFSSTECARCFVPFVVAQMVRKQ